MSDTGQDKEEPRYSIGVVCRRTGLKPDRLRAWERRYGVVEPQRSDGNQRLYTDEEIERLTLLRRLTDAGHRIAQIATLSLDDLADLVADEASVRVPPPDVAPSARDLADAPRILRDCLAAVQQLDATALRTHLDRAAAALSGPALLQELLVPLIHQIGDLWEEGGLDVAHEHLATAVVASFVDGVRVAYDLPDSAPRMVVTTPSSERHELGALLAVATASADGWDVTYLGPDLPAAEIAAVVRQRGAPLVGLSIVNVEISMDLVAAELRTLRRHLGAGVDIVVGGRGAPSHEDALDEIAAVLVEDLSGLRRALQALRPDA